MEPIEEYKKSKIVANTIEINSLECPSKPSKKYFNFSLKKILIFVLFWFLLKPISAFTIRDSFQLCMINDNSPQINLSEACYFNSDSQIYTNGSYFLLERL